ncbi:MAG TPA: TonB-dependent receptor [Candidatus Eremiobacteraceae bacterium]|nr:TonB-dependent receptor [Candidatus Eremiobacteraceae bacterium]
MNRLASWRALAPLVLTLAAFACSAYGQERAAISGTVLDATNAPIQGAQIQFRSSTGVTTTGSDEQGRFRIEGTEIGGTLVVSFPGFATVTREIRARASIGGLQIVMTPTAGLQRIEVQGNTGDRIPAVPASTFEISSEAVDLSGSMAVDDILRQVPGFSTFRRSSSLFANPTSQGVSLRGVGASATSRSNVLLDGIPLNDPFGGWVYWQRIPQQAIETVEVANGGVSDLYGGGALGGVVNIRTRSDEAAYANGELAFGSMSTPDFSFAAGAPIGKWTLSGAGQAYQTQGYISVPPDQRGSVDTSLGSGALAGYLEAARNLGERGRIFVRGSDFGESSKDGTPLTKNDTTIPELDLGVDWSSTEVGTFAARVYGSRELYHQTFSAVALNRDSESLTDVQRNPSQQVGFVGTWSRLFAEKHKVAAGLEAQDVRGHSEETNYHLGAKTALVDAGGRQHSLGVFGQDAYAFARGWVLTFGARVDTWNNNTGYQDRTPLPGGTLSTVAFPNRSETAFSPRVSLLKTFSKGTAVSVSVYRAFRAPTLNELYRNFRVGNVFTMANPALTGEHLTGGEAGISQMWWQNRLTVRGDFFWSDIADPVANVTLTTTPALITREKENLGVIQARGFELGGQLRVTRQIQVSAAYLFVNSIVLKYAANPGLQGNFLPQVPQNQFTAQISYTGRTWTVGMQARFSGNQFDDDQNLLPLGRAFSLDAQVSRKLGKRTSLFFAAQNLTNDRFGIEATPVLVVGPPIFVRGGVRFALR